MERDIIIYLRASEGDRNKQTHTYIHACMKIKNIKKKIVHLEGKESKEKEMEGEGERRCYIEEKETTEKKREKDDCSTGLGDAVDAR